MCLKNYYDIYFDKGAFDDIKKLPKNRIKLIQDAINKRLIQYPLQYGKPLSGSLSGLRRIRVGDYRIIYYIKENSVVITAVGHRKDIYD